MISLVSFAFLVHVLIQKLQDLDRMPIKKCSAKNFDFPAAHKKSITRPSIKVEQFGIQLYDHVLSMSTHYRKLLIQIVNMADICENDMIQIKDMFQIVATWL